MPVLNRDRADPLHLVFTGITQTPANLQRLIEDLNIQPWVHVLGRVSRGELESLYKQAFATAVPSLYEQGSFPLMECFHSVAQFSSDIPSLREQLDAMGSDAIFFDPHSADSFVESLAALERDRTGILARQLAGFERMKKRTWSDAAKEWCEVFREAIATTPNNA